MKNKMKNNNKKFLYAFVLLVILCMVFVYIDCRNVKLSPSLRIKLGYLSEMVKIKKKIIHEIQSNPEAKSIDEIITTINSRNKSNILKSKVDKGNYYIVNKDIKQWKAFISEPKSHKNSIAIYCKITLVSSSPKEKYYWGTFGNKYFAADSPPVMSKN
jgi:hypothetical protein